MKHVISKRQAMCVCAFLAASVTAAADPLSDLGNKILAIYVNNAILMVIFLLVGVGISCAASEHSRGAKVAWGLLGALLIMGARQFAVSLLPAAS